MQKTFIIAEVGVNHNGDIDIAKKMIDVASKAGVDAVKFQTFKTENIVSMNAPKAEYQKENTNNAESQFQMLKKLEIDKRMHIELMEYCKEKNVMFLSTPFDIESIHMLVELGIEIFKIPSGEITNLPYLREVARQKKKIIISTGMSNMQEVKDAVQILRQYGAEDITVLHCNTQYPTPMEDVNLRAMIRMKDELKLEVGYSDHTQGIEVPIAAVTMGATVIEKHFTLDKTMEGPDHKASLEPDELREMVKAIRNIEKALGNGEKNKTQSEVDNVAIVRKSIVAACKIEKGELFTEKNLTVKRPGNGISPMKWDEVIGIESDRTYEIDEMIEL